MSRVSFGKQSLAAAVAAVIADDLVALQRAVAAGFPEEDILRRLR
jgi:hypothetical protein